MCVREREEERKLSRAHGTSSVNYAHRSPAHCNVVKGASIGKHARSFAKDGRMIRDSIAASSPAITAARTAMAVALLWKYGCRAERNTANTQDDRPGPDEPNGRAFRDREFFTRIIRLRQDPSIRYGEGRILFPSLRRRRGRGQERREREKEKKKRKGELSSTKRPRTSAAYFRILHTGSRGSPYEIISEFYIARTSTCILFSLFFSLSLLFGEETETRRDITLVEICIATIRGFRMSPTVSGLTYNNVAPTLLTEEEY